MNNITKLLKDSQSRKYLKSIFRSCNCINCPAKQYCDTQSDTTCEETFRDWCLMEE